jgi:hypothetical protein
MERARDYDKKFKKQAVQLYYLHTGYGSCIRLIVNLTLKELMKMYFKGK